VCHFKSLKYFLPSFWSSVHIFHRSYFVHLFFHVMILSIDFFFFLRLWSRSQSPTPGPGAERWSTFWPAPALCEAAPENFLNLFLVCSPNHVIKLLIPYWAQASSRFENVRKKKRDHYLKKREWETTEYVIKGKVSNIRIMRRKHSLENMITMRIYPTILTPEFNFFFQLFMTITWNCKLKMKQSASWPPRHSIASGDVKLKPIMA